MTSIAGHPGPKLARATAAILLACLLTILTTGCVLPAYWQAEQEEKAKRAAEEIADEEIDLRPLKSGEAVTVTFPADGIWHPTQYLIQPGEQLRVAPTPGSAMFPTGAISFRIGNKRLTLADQKMDFTVTKGGPLLVRFNRNIMPNYTGDAEIYLEKLD